MRKRISPTSIVPTKKLTARIVCSAYFLSIYLSLVWNEGIFWVLEERSSAVGVYIAGRWGRTLWRLLKAVGHYNPWLCIDAAEGVVRPRLPFLPPRFQPSRCRLARHHQSNTQNPKPSPHLPFCYSLS